MLQQLLYVIPIKRNFPRSAFFSEWLLRQQTTSFSSGLDLTSEITQKCKEPKHVPVLGFMFVAASPLPEAGKPVRRGKK